MTYVQRHAYGFGCAFAALLWPFFRRRQRIAIDNILKCSVADDAKEARRIAKASWCHLAGHICEALCAPNVITADNWREHLDVSGLDAEAVRVMFDEPDTPILIVSSHHGAWEVATNLLSFARPMIAIARVQNNQMVARWMKKHHFRGSITLVDKNRGFTPQVIRQWERERAAMTILMDQHAGNGELLEFLGRPAYTYTSATRLAMRTGHPIVVGSFVRIAPYRYRVVGGAVIRLSRFDDRRKATQVLNDRLGEAIRMYPEQYLWAHRRWRCD